MGKLKSVKLINYATGKSKRVRVGQVVKWRQPGLNRWLEGKIIEIYESTATGPNMSRLTIKLKSGKILKIRAWVLL